ncbi:peptidase [Nakamurella endophytica]|uniref:Aminopeptidase N n=1 Tax=Nakamurella endophytica TaxID=1748367 RepID=A0A917T0B5_9ACTN|nr:peptidase [Nakamurella endophytica]
MGGTAQTQGSLPTSVGPSGTPGVTGTRTDPSTPDLPVSGSGTATGKSGTAPSATPSTGRAADPDGAAGAAGIGDPYYPLAGNGGYQVDSYDVTLTYDPAANRLSARTAVEGSVTAPGRLGRFDLDLQPSMRVSQVQVGDTDAAFRQDGAELVVTPARGLDPGAALSVVVDYAGQPGEIRGGTAGASGGGWYRTDSGGAVVAGEPFSASAWYPVNEHPADLATFTVTATVPTPWQVISGGVRLTDGVVPPPAGMATFRWAQRVPVASYLTTVYIDRFSTEVGTLPDGRLIVSAFAPGSEAGRYRKLAADTARIVEVLADHFGRYPFEAVGGIYTGQPLAFALETATRPVYADWVDTDTIVHELAHQWYGDSVAVQRWRDICLNECLASYAPLLWHEDVDGTDLDRWWTGRMKAVAGDARFWRTPLVDMGPGREFSSVYDRGPLAVHALRKEIGEAAFATVLREWPTRNAGRTVTFEAWQAFVEQVAGRDLSGFFDAWFRGRVVPSDPYRHPGGL